VKYVAHFKGRRGTAQGRFESLRGFRRALLSLHKYLPVVSTIEVDLNDALEIGLVSDAKMTEVDTALENDVVFHIVLRQRSPMAEMGIKGGSKSGETKRRGDTDYYRELAKKRVR
jgi:hypothetical protein